MNVKTWKDINIFSIYFSISVSVHEIHTYSLQYAIIGNYDSQPIIKYNPTECAIILYKIITLCNYIN
jgi:hypothetical protein